MPHDRPENRPRNRDNRSNRKVDRAGINDSRESESRQRHRCDIARQSIQHLRKRTVALEQEENRCEQEEVARE